MAIQLGTVAPDFTHEPPMGPHPLPRVDRRQVGRFCSRTRRTSRPSARRSSAPRRKLKAEFDKRNVKVIASASTTSPRTSWIGDIEETQNDQDELPDPRPTPTARSRSSTG